MGGSGRNDDDDGRVGSVSGSTGPRAVDEVTSAESAAGVSEIAGVSAAAIDAITAALAAGSITPAQARGQLVDKAVQASLPPGASEAVRDELRRQVTQALEDDPVLERLLTP